MSGIKSSTNLHDPIPAVSVRSIVWITVPKSQCTEVTESVCEQVPKHASRILSSRKLSKIHSFYGDETTKNLFPTLRIVHVEPGLRNYARNQHFHILRKPHILILLSNVIRGVSLAELRDIIREECGGNVL
jgi:hypothetical protein